MIHSGGVGTPLEHMATDPMEACVSCHMPDGEHLFRISVDAELLHPADAGRAHRHRQRQRRARRQLPERGLGRPGRRLRQVPRRRTRARRDHRQRLPQVLGRGSDQQQHQLRRSGRHLVADHQVHGSRGELRGLRLGVRHLELVHQPLHPDGRQVPPGSRPGRRRHDGRAADRSGGRRLPLLRRRPATPS